MKKGFFYVFLFFSFGLLLLPLKSFSFSRPTAKHHPSKPTVTAQPKTVLDGSQMPALYCPPSAELCQADEKVGLFFDVYGIIWQSKEGTMEYAAKEKYIDSSNRSLTYITPDFGWRPGFKVDLGYYIPYDNWDIKANWTSYEGGFSLNKKHVNVGLTPGDNGVIPLQFSHYFLINGMTSDDVRFNHATGDLNLYFDSLDLEAGRYFWVGKKFSLRPFAGLKAGWVDQNYIVYYDIGNTLEDTSSNLNQLLHTKIRFKNDSFGIGPRIGFEAKCHLKGGLQLLAGGSFNMLPTRFKIKRNQEDITLYTPSGGSTTYNYYTLKTQDKFHQVNANIGLQLGFGYGDCFFKHYFLGMFLSYEMQYWWAQNQIHRLISYYNPSLDYNSRGDLMLHGLTAYIKFEF